LDYKLHLFAVNLTGKTPGPILGDGTSGEEGASVFWAPLEDALRVSDPSIAATIAHLLVDQRVEI